LRSSLNGQTRIWIATLENLSGRLGDIDPRNPGGTAIAREMSSAIPYVDDLEARMIG
jgi:hypothetical protein